jgi:hypothetical protein
VSKELLQTGYCANIACDKNRTENKINFFIIPIIKVFVCNKSREWQ